MISASEETIPDQTSAQQRFINEIPTERYTA